eukprot:g12496.t1
MDDTTSRQQIDELADLYLTDPGQEAGPLDGPAPIKLAPKVAGEAAPPNEPPTQSPLDEMGLANEPGHPILRLTEEEQAELDVPLANTDDEQDPISETTDEPAPRAVLEAVLMGNLPGMSGPWLTQYAQLLAQTEGPVILLHLGEEAIDLELIEPRAEAQPTPAQPSATVRIPPMRGHKTGLVGLVDALVRSEQTPARTILVRFDSTGDAQTLSRLAAIDDWTLLCGSDSASIAGASQQLRSAVHNDPRLADRNVGIMVMGSDDDAAAHAAKQIASELEHDLANPVEPVGHLKRMQPVQVRDLGSFPDPVGLWPKLVGFFDSLEIPEPIVVPEPAPRPEPVAVQPPPTAPKPKAPAGPAAASRPATTPRFRQARPSSSSIAGGLRTPDTRTSVASQQTTASASGARRSPAINTQQEESSPSIATPMRPAPTPRVLTPQPELDLAALIAQGPAALDRPVVLDARIPDQPDTQLAVDAQGTVHLLAQSVGGSGVVSEHIMQLIEAGQWVTDHLELIALTQRDHDFVDTPPRLHLLTDQAAQLVGKAPNQVQLHLLQQVAIGKETGWFCTPMG